MARRSRRRNPLGPSLGKYRVWKSIVAALQALLRADAISVGLTLASAAAQGLLPVGYTLVIRNLVDSFASKDHNWPQVFHQTLLILSVTVLLSSAKMLRQYAEERMRAQIWLSLSQELIAKCVLLDAAEYERPETYSALARAKSEIGYRPISLLQSSVSVSQSAITIIAFCVVIGAFSLPLLLIMLLSAIPSIFLAQRIGSLTFDAYNSATESGRLAAYLDDVLTSPRYFSDIRVHGAADGFVGRRLGSAIEATRRRLRASVTRLRHTSALELLANVAQYGAFAFVAWKATRGDVSVGNFTLLAGALTALQAQLVNIALGVGQLTENGLFFSNLSDFHRTARVVRDPDPPQDIAITDRPSLSIDHVSFRYPGHQNDVLHDISMFIPSGSVCAIVGPNGSGKSTLVRLLARLYEPTEGIVSVDGHDVRHFTHEAYEETLGVVLQDFARLELSIRDAVTFGRQWNEVRFNRVCDEAGLTTWMASLPQGPRTMLGKQFDDLGVRPSGGQWQRIAMARLLYRNPQVVILDEPTANLDPESEISLFRNYLRLFGGRTIILVSHRMNTVRLADLIYVMSDGRVQERGTHGQLIAMDSAYARMFHAQADGYQP